ncbi:isocitrate dehydrogenase [NAD] regulatory subunit 1, mitochondrial isoform X3 [Phragmites australis]|uniref:isocitrate dehydrogenase [NAD] regulatory subunit 1, mitochondrial isoform X3 n=1 Tax=Phragmites australis TaxID=29695 RepID=UPI002D77CFF1|nr:isocitrate dehydrogenase [NAD] regulatory subunit 1, mitochondrial isoform X3 [Phragmites australis]
MARRTTPLLRRLLSPSPSPTPSAPLAGAVSRRGVTYMPRPGDGAPRGVTLIPGDGIGPLVTGAVRQVMEVMHAPVYFETYEVHGDMPTVPAEVIESIRRNKVCLKGGLATPVGGGVSSLNVQLRKELDLYASLVNCFNLPGLPTRHDNVDIVVIRENTEGEYSGLEHEVVPGVVESLKVTPNLYGNLVANTAAGIAGGTGVMPGGNVGQDTAIFEQGASAGNVGNKKIVEQKKANPVALLLSSAMMLRHLQFPSFADRLETAVKRVIAEGKYRTKDLGGTSTTQEVTDAVIAKLD